MSPFYFYDFALRILDNWIHFVIFVMVIIISTPFSEEERWKEAKIKEIPVLILNSLHDKIKNAMTKWSRSYDKILASHDKILASHDKMQGQPLRKIS